MSGSNVDATLNQLLKHCSTERLLTSLAERFPDDSTGDEVFAEDSSFESCVTFHFIPFQAPTDTVIQAHS